MKQISLRQ
ncbi:Protein of unknown function [Gryllus bimaculatus]|nr:Protein of unknown function [Gryllus bimaculatus]